MKNIILLHGALGCARDLEPLAAILKNEGFGVRSFSFSGHGSEPFRAGFTIPDFAAELKDFVITSGLQKPALFGYSMGGYVALYAASEYKGLLGPIATLATKMKWDAETANKESLKLSPANLMAKAPAYVDQLRGLHGDKWESLLEKTAFMMTDIAVRQFLEQGRLQSLESPVMMGLGDRDHMVSLEETLLACKKIPEAGMYVLPRTKHALESANGHLLSALIRDFIAA